MQETVNEQKLTLENRKRLTMSGVESVDSFSDKELKLTVGGDKVLVGGEGIKITAYNKGSGVLGLAGVNDMRDLEERVAAGFRAIAATESERVRLVDAGRGIDAIHADVRALVFRQ